MGDKYEIVMLFVRNLSKFSVLVIFVIEVSLNEDSFVSFRVNVIVSNRRILSLFFDFGKFFILGVLF